MSFKICDDVQCTLCVILHLASENKEIVLQQQSYASALGMENSNSFIFSAVSDTQAVPQTTPAPAPQTTQHPS